MSFRDNIRVSVIVYRVSVIVHIKMIKISCKTVFFKNIFIQRKALPIQSPDGY